MRKIMVFQHVAHEPLGILDGMLRRSGFRIRFVNFERQPDFIPSIENYNGLIVLGGPMGVYEAEQRPHLKVEMKVIEEALKKNVPVLGICLGAQLLAGVLGAHVRKAKDWEFSWNHVHITDQGSQDPLFGTWDTSEKVFQLHQDTFDVPNGAEHLAWSELCEGQAFRYGEKAYGLQFHLEVDPRMITRWLHRPEHKKLMEALKGGHTEESVQMETKARMERSLALAEATFGKFIELFKLPPRHLVLGSTR